MKHILLGLVLLGLAGSSSLMAQDRDWRNNRDSDWRRADHGRHDVYRDYRDRRGGERCDRRGGYRDTRRDEREIEHDRWEIREDVRRGDYAAAQREREEMRERYRDLDRDRRYSQRRNSSDAYYRDRGWDWARFALSGWR